MEKTSSAATVQSVEPGKHLHPLQALSAGCVCVCGLCWKSDGCGFPLQGKLEPKPLKCVCESRRKRAVLFPRC